MLSPLPPNWSTAAVWTHPAPQSLGTSTTDYSILSLGLTEHALLPSWQLEIWKRRILLYVKWAKHNNYGGLYDDDVIKCIIIIVIIIIIIIKFIIIIIIIAIDK